MSVARNVTASPVAVSWIPPSDGSVARVETARLTSCRVAVKSSREIVSFIWDRSSSYLDQMYQWVGMTVE